LRDQLYWRLGDEEKFDDRVRRTESHWIWVGYVDPRDGYGRFKPRHNEGAELAHRLAYVRWVGPIPEGCVIDHVDHPWPLRRCVQPDHLEAITHEENTRRGQSPAGRNARLENCPRCGDPLRPPFATLRANGERRCKRCQRAEHARYRARKRAAAQADAGR
jgi:HNH endonuclease